MMTAASVWKISKRGPSKRLNGQVFEYRPIITFIKARNVSAQIW